MAGQVTELLARHGFVPLMRDNLAKVQYNCVYVRDDSRHAELSRPIAAKYFDNIKNLATA